LGTHGKLIPLILIESRKLAACTREKIMEKVEAVFDAGSVQVFAVEIDSYGDHKNTGKLCNRITQRPHSPQTCLILLVNKLCYRKVCHHHQAIF
jgi:hypothetical protein